MAIILMNRFNTSAILFLLELVVRNAPLPTARSRACDQPTDRAGKNVPADSFARAVAFAMSQPEDVDVNEILYRPTRQEY